MLTSQLDLSNNQLCGVDFLGRGTYTTEGITSIANALKVTPSLTVTDMRRNDFDTESATMLVSIAKDKGISLCGITPDQTEANLSWSEMGPADAILLTADLAVRASVTSVNVLSNGLDVESADLLLKVKAEKPSLRTLCGLTHKETELHLSAKRLRVGDAKLLAPEILVMASLTSVR